MAWANFPPRADDDGDEGQGTVEYAMVTAGLIAIIVGLGALLHLWDAGVVVAHGLQSASHAVNAIAGCIADVFCY